MMNLHPGIDLDCSIREYESRQLRKVSMSLPRECANDWKLAQECNKNV